MCIVVAAAGLLCAGTVQQSLDAHRDEMDLATGEEATRDFAELKLIQAIPGGLRALVVDYLWIQIEEMKQQGKYYDAAQKSEMICKLQPRFPAVWHNRAWNMAYNLSFEAHTPPERWAWVSRGIELIRNQGLKYNPKSLQLYKELAWLYLHKIGEMLDDMHWAYKGYLAAEFHRVLGAPPKSIELRQVAMIPTDEATGPPIGATPAGADSTESDPADSEGPDELTLTHLAWLQPIVDAPDDVEQLLADPSAAAFVARLKALGVDVGMEMLDAYNLWSDDPRVRMLGQPVSVAKTETQQAVRALMTDSETAAARLKVLAFSRRKVLVETYNMRPWWMAEVVRTYGPVDWRLCWPHCLYWASYGLQHCKGLDIGRIDTLNTSRLILNPLKALVSYGSATLVYNKANPSQPFLMMEPNWRFIASCQNAHEEMAKLHEGPKETFFGAGHENFLISSVQTLFMAGRISEAQKYFGESKDRYGKWSPKLYALDLEQFVYQSINPDGIPNRARMAQLVNGQVRRAYRYLAMGYDESFRLYTQQAFWFWKKWRDGIDGDPRKVLEPFDVIQGRAALNVLGRIPLESGVTLWPYIPLPARQDAYDQMIELFTPLCEQENVDFAKAFPEPPGMEQYRKTRDAMIRQRDGAPYKRNPANQQ